MNKKTIKILVFFAGISLSGLIFMQTFWMNKSLMIAEEQFDQHSLEAIHDVTREIRHRNDSLYARNNEFFYIKINKPFFELIDTASLDSLFQLQFDYYNLGKDFAYQILNESRDSVLYSSPSQIAFFSKEPTYQVCLWRLPADQNYNLNVFFPGKDKAIFNQMLKWFLLSFLFLLVVIFCFGYTIFIIIQQKKLSEMKTDFINNMTHEFKTPLATISLASEMLEKKASEMSNERFEKYAHIIRDENERMKQQVDRVLQVAILEKHEYNLSLNNCDIHEIVKKAAGKLCIEKEENAFHVTYDLKAEQPKALIDKIHFTNVVVNILDNAIKYSPGSVQLVISSFSDTEGIWLSIADNGIGLSKDSLAHIFEKFYRVHTGDIHNVKGFGLGLYYVKRIVEAHHGRIEVKSELGKGTCFTIFVPNHGN